MKYHWQLSKITFWVWVSRFLFWIARRSEALAKRAERRIMWAMFPTAMRLHGHVERDEQ